MKNIAVALTVVLSIAFFAGCVTVTAQNSGVPGMIELLKKNKWDKKQAAITFAGSLKNSDWYVRKEALLGLALLGEDAQSSSSQIITALRDRNPNVREAAAWALGGIFFKSRHVEIQNVVSALSRTLDDSYWMARCAAAYSLGLIGLEANTAIPSLVDTMKDSNWWVRMIAGDSVKKIQTAK